MVRLLLKKQLMEIFRSYLYNAKKNKKRSKLGIIGSFLIFALIMVGALGGMFTFLGFTLAGPLASLQLGWLYFLLFSLASVALGVFGSVFNTFSGLYLAKDNDLLLSMPIPPRDIVLSRLLNVYVMGLMYSGVVLIPGIIVYSVCAGFTAGRLLGGIVLLLLVTVLVLLLSCLLGWCVAKLSLKLKNKSFVTVAISVLFIAAYYFFYFRASLILQDLIANAAAYGYKVRTSMKALYLFGTVGEGNITAIALYTLVFAALLYAMWRLLVGSFLGIATATGASSKKEYREKPVKAHSPFAALLNKELSRFTSGAAYMLNCGLGLLFIVIFAAVLIFKGQYIMEILREIFGSTAGAPVALLITGLSMVGATCDIAAPSVSLEGKSLWLMQSLPVEGRQVLRAKLCLQLVLTAVPLCLAIVCALPVSGATAGESVFLFLLPLSCCLFSAAFGTFLAIKLPVLTWSSELIPIKQSAAVLLALLGSMVYVVALCAAYMLIGYKLGTVGAFSAGTAFTLLLSGALIVYLEKNGNRLVAAL